MNVKRLKVDIWTQLDELQAMSTVSDRQSAENSVVTDKGGMSILFWIKAMLVFFY